MSFRDGRLRFAGFRRAFFFYQSAVMYTLRQGLSSIFTLDLSPWLSGYLKGFNSSTF